MTRVMNIFSDEISNIEDQEKYKEKFMQKFGSKIDADDPFYFDDIELVDGTTNETIRGIKLTIDSWERITNTLIRYFHLDM